MHSFEMAQTTRSHLLPALEASPATILQEITLGVHHLSILSDQSIIVRCEQNETEEAAQEFHLDARETYRLMQCLREVFPQTPMYPVAEQLCRIDTDEKKFYNDQAF
jgi:hypothetical protein